MRLLQILLLLFTYSFAQIPAFPGAEGFGKYTTGGRGGKVIYVTNLNTSGPGSFEAAMNDPDPAYILFKVSGLIRDFILYNGGNKTIAGQTSPGGIIVRGIISTGDEHDTTTIYGHDNNIFRHLRVRYTNEQDQFRLHSAKRVIVDHCSFALANDECMQLARVSKVSIQNCILAETHGGHTRYGGLLIPYGSTLYPLDSISITKNLFMRLGGRLPEFRCFFGEICNGHVISTEVVNNYYHDPAVGMEFMNVAGNEDLPGGVCYFGFYLNLINNYYRVRSTYVYPMLFDDFMRAASGLGAPYLSGNRMSKFTNEIDKDYRLVNCCNPFTPTGSYPAYWTVDTTHTMYPHPIQSFMSVDSLRNYMINNVGARPAYRDSMDRRYEKWLVLDSIDTSITFANNLLWNDHWLFDFDTLNPPAYKADTDNDGMPDDWEIANNLNPNDSNPNATTLSVSYTGISGYTDLEVYLNALSDSLVYGTSTLLGDGPPEILSDLSWFTSDTTKEYTIVSDTLIDSTVADSTYDSRDSTFQSRDSTLSDIDTNVTAGGESAPNTAYITMGLPWAVDAVANTAYITMGLPVNPVGEPDTTYDTTWSYHDSVYSYDTTWSYTYDYDSTFTADTTDTTITVVFDSTNTFDPGDTVNLTWSETNITENVVISVRFTTDWIPIDTVSAGIETFTYTFPDSSADSGRFKVESGSAVDSSYWFSLNGSGPEPPELPVITVQPHDSTVDENQPVSFSITATGATSYKVFRNSDSVWNQDVYSFIAVLSDSGDSIWFDVCNDDGCTRSDTVFLHVNDTLLIGTQRVWSSTSSTVGELETNWSGAGPILPTDTLVWNGTSVVNCTFTENTNVNAVIINNTYTGAWSNVNHELTANSFSADGTGTLHLGNVININGAYFHIGNGVGVVTSSSCVLTFTGTNIIVDADKPDPCVKQFIVSENSSVVLTGSGVFGGSNSTGETPVILGDNSRVSGTSQFTSRCSASCLGIQVGEGARIDVTGNFFIGSQNATDSIVITIPPLNLPKGRLYLSSRGAGYATFRLTGNLLTNYLYTVPNSTFGSAMTFDTDNYNVTAKNWLTGATRAGAYVTNNIRSSFIHVNTYNSSTYTTDSTFLICDGATLYWSYNWITGSRQRITGAHTFQHHDDLFMGHSKIIDYSDTVWSPAYYYHRDYQHGYYINRGVSGSSVIHCSNRLDSCLTAFTPNRFFLWYGGAGLATTDSQTFIDTVATYMSAFNSIISRVKAAGVDSIYIIGLAPYNSMDSSQVVWQKGLNQQIIDSCITNGLFYIDAWNPLVTTGTEHTLIDSFSTDGKHPNSTILGAEFCGYLLSTGRLITQPTNDTVLTGQPGMFWVGYTGTDFNVAWYKNGVFTGVYGDTLKIAGKHLDSIQAVLWNAEDTVSSSMVYLYVVNAPFDTAKINSFDYINSSGNTFPASGWSIRIVRGIGDTLNTTITSQNEYGFTGITPEQPLPARSRYYTMILVNGEYTITRKLYFSKEGQSGVIFYFGGK